MTAQAALLASLDRELGDYRELHAISRDKGARIVQGDMDALRGMVEAEIECLAHLQQAEIARAKAAAELAEEHGLAPGSTLQDILAQLPEEQRRTMQERRHALLSVMDEVRRLNAANETLLHQSLAYVEFSLDLIHRAAVGADTYDGSGRRPRSLNPTWQRRA